jgi:hypothetical protein
MLINNQFLAMGIFAVWLISVGSWQRSYDIFPENKYPEASENFVRFFKRSTIITWTVAIIACVWYKGSESFNIFMCIYYITIILIIYFIIKALTARKSIFDYKLTETKSINFLFVTLPLVYNFIFGSISLVSVAVNR